MTDPEEALDARSILLDCRWLGLGGAGRVTELLLRELQTTTPAGQWTLWGDPERIEPLRPAGVDVIANRLDPRRSAGQAARPPRRDADVVLYMHQIRPISLGRSVTVIHDTIPLRYGGGRASRLAKRAFFGLVANATTAILTDSTASRENIRKDLGVREKYIDVMRFPIDVARARRIADRRALAAQEARVLYLGRFDRHKNLERLCDAFQLTRFAAEGATLSLVGGWDDEVDMMRRWVAARGMTNVSVHPSCSEPELDDLLATSRALAMPSLEEGYGLPAFEAAASGLPVAVARTGAMGDIPDDRAVFLDPRSERSIATALDEAVTRPYQPASELGVPHLAQAVLAAAAFAVTRPVRR